MLPKLPATTLLITLLGACSSNVYLRDGVTDGDTFYLSQQALVDDDPLLQSWVRYSLAKSTCQLEMGGDNPARNSSFDCELVARRHLVDAWREQPPADRGRHAMYLNELLLIDRQGYLDEYVADHFRRREWQMPDDLELRAYRRWAHQRLPGHQPETRLVGSWNYATRVTRR
jgi:hypothetical protein